MPAIIPASSNEHMAVVKATAAKYFKGASDLTPRRRLWLAMLQKQGKIVYNATSHSLTWAIECYQPEVRAFGDAGDQEFTEHDALELLTVDVRGYTATDKLTKKQRLMNRGKEQIYNLYDSKMKNLLKSMQTKVCGELYIDGNATGNNNRLMGIETFMADDGNTVVADIIAKPSDTYAGKSTAPGTFGGNWTDTLSTPPNATLSNDWPYGSGDSQYDAISPLLINYSSTSFSSGQNDWINNCEEVLRLSSIVCANKSGDDTVPMLHLLDAKMYNDFLNFYSARNRQLVPHKESSDLGFGKTMNLDGAAVKFEFDCPTGTGYGISVDDMELMCMEDQLFVPDGPEWSIEKKSWLFEVGFFGNLRFQPKHFAKYKAYAAS